MSSFDCDFVFIYNIEISVPLNVLIRKLANFQIEGIFSAGYVMQSHSVVLPVSSKVLPVPRIEAV